MAASSNSSLSGSSVSSGEFQHVGCGGCAADRLLSSSSCTPGCREPTCGRPARSLGVGWGAGVRGDTCLVCQHLAVRSTYAPDSSQRRGGRAVAPFKCADFWGLERRRQAAKGAGQACTFRLSWSWAGGAGKVRAKLGAWTCWRCLVCYTRSPNPKQREQTLAPSTLGFLCLFQKLAPWRHLLGA